MTSAARSPTSARSIIESGLARAATLAAATHADERLHIARTAVVASIRAYWEVAGIDQRLREPSAEAKLVGLSPKAGWLATTIGKAAARLDSVEAGYAIGVLYLGMMPSTFRAALGAYYTPPALCERLLDMAADAGVDWTTARVLDPACGGGAFLAPVALRMAASQRGLSRESAEASLASIEGRLMGLELDPFAAWLSQVFLDAALADLCAAAGRRIRPVVRACDALRDSRSSAGFDLVVGNPPYGRTKLSPKLRRKFARSLFGHANLYGVFTDLALRFTREMGVIAYVTPTSFLAGEYFKALRGLLGREAPPLSMDFVAQRKGVFADVLQETLLTVYRRDGHEGRQRTAKVYFQSPANGGVAQTTAGYFTLPEVPERPWLIPRSQAQSAILVRIRGLAYRLADWGYGISTGPLVWNRHRTGLRDRPGERRYPLVWAESVRRHGVFEFRAEKRNHEPYFEPRDDERWVVTDFPCVLLQRTTAKEQSRRLIAAELPASFVEEHGGVVVENHLNMVKPINGAPLVAPAALAALLNSDLADQVFRCINGSVAVSAYELAALPLPAPENVRQIESLVASGGSRDALEAAVVHAYGCEGI